MTRVPSPLFAKMLKKTLEFFYSEGGIVPITAINVSGFTSSMPVTITLGEPEKRKNFLKTSIAMDTRMRVILCSKITRKTVHDVNHAEPLLR